MIAGVTLIETWQALERLVDDGQCKAIGPVRCHIGKIARGRRRLRGSSLPWCKSNPTPYLPECELLDFCREHGIVLLRLQPWDTA